MRLLQQIIIPFLFLIGFANIASAQGFDFYQEIGIVAGPSFLKSDYGQRDNWQTNASNFGFGIGIVHYMSWAYTRYNGSGLMSHLREHTKVRSELSFTNAKFQNYGKYIQDYLTSPDAMQLKAMRGETNVVNLGMGAEYSFRSIHDYEASDGSFSPFVSLGLQANYYMPKSYSLLGDYSTPGVLFPKFAGGITNNSALTGSLLMGVGTRYKLDAMNDLILELRGQYYFSDWVDGLRPPPATNSGNKYNDWNVWFNFGFIHYLED